MFCWEPEGHYHHWLYTAIAPFWFSTEHIWTALMPFWLSTDNMQFKVSPFHPPTLPCKKSVKYQFQIVNPDTNWSKFVKLPKFDWICLLWGDTSKFTQKGASFSSRKSVVFCVFLSDFWMSMMTDWSGFLLPRHSTPHHRGHNFTWINHIPRLVLESRVWSVCHRLCLSSFPS